MARKVENTKVTSRSARATLPVRREPFWTVISPGCALGYRKGSKSGTWIARFRDETGKQHYDALAAADDAMDPNGETILSFAQAQEAARASFVRKLKAIRGEVREGPYSVKSALDDYFTDRERRASKGIAADRSAANARIVPALGARDVNKLTTKQIRDWHSAVASAPKLVRSKSGATERATKPLDNEDGDAVRARRSTANRLLTILKAALNHAFREGDALSDEVWRKVKPFREVDVAVVRFLKPTEIVNLVAACDEGFRDLVRGALLTGARYGELIRMEVGDFSANAGTVTIRVSKSGKPRHIALNAEGVKFFSRIVADRARVALMFARANGEAWAASHQQRPLAEASKKAGIRPAPTFHILRHTYASTLAMEGVPIGVIAAQLGHADTRITEKHYAHLSPNYVAEAIRAGLPRFGIADDDEGVAILTVRAFKVS